MSIGKRIQEARIKKGITQAQLAQSLGVSPVMISQYEHDKRKPKWETLQKIASALNISTAYLFGWEDTTTISSLENDYYGNLNNGSERDDILRVLFHIGYKATPNIFSFNAKDGIKTWTITDIQTQKKYIVPADELEKLDEQIMSFSKNQIEELLNTWKE